MSVLSRLRRPRPRSLRVNDTPVATVHPSSARVASVLAFSLPKAGSVLLENMIAGLAREVRVNTFSLEQRLFEHGIAPEACPPDAAGLFVPRGVAYTGFRRLPTTFRIPIIDSAQQVLLVRDPRDMLVSLYFSITRSHRPPGGGDSEARARFDQDRRAVSECPIDQFVQLRAQGVADLFATYEPILDSPRLRVFRYEDVLYEKRRWARDICEHFAWDIDQARSDKVADRNDVIPSAETPDAHVRRAHPGDHREKLTPGAIGVLNQMLAPILDRYGYERQANPAPAAAYT